MYCENCGTKLPDDSAFCQECGSKISFAEKENRRGPVPPVMRQTTPRQPEEPYGRQTAPGQPAEPYGRQTSSGQPAEPYGRQTEPRQPEEPYGRQTTPIKQSESSTGGPADIISFGQYAFMIFISGIPFINVILMLKWAFNKQKPNKSNFAKALLFYYLIAVIIYAAYIWLWLKATSSI